MQADIEKDYHYLYGEVSTDNGVTWKQVGTPLTAISAWTKRSWDLSAYKGQSVQFRFTYVTDGGSLKGAFIDDVTVTKDGVAGAVDDVEAGAGAWTAKGCTIISGTVTTSTPRYYIAENRTYTGYDATLQTGPYTFGWSTTKPKWVERFPYQNGVLVSYVDHAYNDNNTITHPGAGLVLPVDARPAPIVLSGGVLLGHRRQPFDTTFGQEATDAVTFHRNGIATRPVVAGHADLRRQRPEPLLERDQQAELRPGRRHRHVDDRHATRDGGNELQGHVAFRG